MEGFLNEKTTNKNEQKMYKTKKFFLLFLDIFCSKSLALFLGRQFDKDGNLKQWWNDRTIEAFRKRKQCIVDQYSNYKLEQIDMYINGKMTQGENIADNGGLKQSFRVSSKFYSTPF